MFTLVTHLTVSDGSIFDSAVEGWAPFLAQLPSLTHLAIHYGFHMLDELLTSCKKLEVMVFLHPSRIPAGQRIYLNSVGDPRFLFMALPALDQVDDWVRGTRGGMDFWARADAFVAKKRRGEIEPSRFSSRFFTLLIIVLNFGCFKVHAAGLKLMTGLALDISKIRQSIFGRFFDRYPTLEIPVYFFLRHGGNSARGGIRSKISRVEMNLSSTSKPVYARRRQIHFSNAGTGATGGTLPAIIICPL